MPTPQNPFMPPNGWRLSGARKGVRCSRGLGATPLSSMSDAVDCRSNNTTEKQRSTEYDQKVNHERDHADQTGQRRASRRTRPIRLNVHDRKSCVRQEWGEQQQRNENDKNSNASPAREPRPRPGHSCQHRYFGGA